MRTDVAYEITDLRYRPTFVRVGIIRPKQDGIEVYGYSAPMPTFLTWDDDDPAAFVDDEKRGTVSIVTSQGRVEFTRISSGNWAGLEPFFDFPGPLSKDDTQLNSDLYKWIWES